MKTPQGRDGRASKSFTLEQAKALQIRRDGARVGADRLELVAAAVEPVRYLLIPVTGITGPDEQDRRGVSALLAVINSVRAFGWAITAPLGAPAGIPMAYIEVPFTSGEKNLRPDGVIQVKRGSALWTVLIEVKTSANELRAAQVESYLDVAREQGSNAVLTISNQLAGAPGEHPLTVDKRKLKKVSLHYLSWSQIRTEALVEQGNKAVSDPDQAWILAEFIRYLEHPRSGAVEFEDMGASWVAVREAVKAGTLQSGLLREHWAGGLAPAAGASGPVQRSCAPVRSRRAAWSGRLRQRREPLCTRSG